MSSTECSNGDGQCRKRQRSDAEGNAVEHCSSAQTPPQKEGGFCHIEYFSRDKAATYKFFNTMFGWPIHPLDSENDYFPLSFICANARPRLESDNDSTVSYILVDDIHEATKRAVAAGATLLSEPKDCHGHGWYAYLRLPGDVLQAFWQLAKKTPSAADSSSAAADAAVAKAIKPHTARVSIISVLVSDQDLAISFYCGKLGFVVTKDADCQGCRWVTIRAPQQQGVELTLITPQNDADRAAVGKQTGSVPFLVIDTDDVQADYERLKADGVEFTQEPTDRFYGIESLLRDPFGNIINLIQPKEH